MNNSSKFFQPTWLYIKKHNLTGLMYFGRTTEKDPIKYRGSGTYWKRHIKIHGNDVTTLWVHLYTDKHLIKEEATAFSYSHDIINSNKWANLTIEDGINGSAKGRKTKPCTEETKNKISQALKNSKLPRGMQGKSHTADTKNKIKEAIIAKGGRSESTKQKIREANVGKVLSAEIRQKISNSNKGRKCPKTLGHRQNLSLANRGKTLTSDVKNKISLSLKGKPKKQITCEHCGKIGAIANISRWHGNKCKLKMDH
jgi:hypothetical protein